jgi:hypothetical protein
MKTRITYLVVVLVCVICGAADAQRPAQVPFVNDQSAKPLTDLEAFQDIYGATLLKGFTDLPRIRGNGGSLQIAIVDFRNMSNNTRVKGVSAEITIGERTADKTRSFIEYAELDGLIKGVMYISKVDRTATSMQNLEAVFTTKGEFSISNFFTFQGEPRVAVTVGRYEPKTLILDQTSQTTLLAQLQQAKSTLDEL